MSNNVSDSSYILLSWSTRCALLCKVCNIGIVAQGERDHLKMHHVVWRNHVGDKRSRECVNMLRIALSMYSSCNISPGPRGYEVKLPGLHEFVIRLHA